MTYARFSLRMPDDLVEWVDHVVYERRRRRLPGRSATRSAVLVDLVRRAATEQSSQTKDAAR